MGETAVAPNLTETQLQSLENEGYCVIEDVLSLDQCAEVRRRLDRAAQESRRRGAPTYIEALDPNDRNVRVFNLLDLDDCFIELIQHPTALAGVRAVLGEHFLISNFTANIALPGSRSMALHSDQALVVPEPWLAPWSMNAIWCLDDVYEANGATRYLPESHKCTRLSELPSDPVSRMRPFKAPAGAVIVMEGRLWHTSGANVTENRERALLFGYYTLDFIRPQVNWSLTLSEATRARLTPQMRTWLGLEAVANYRVGGAIIGANIR